MQTENKIRPKLEQVYPRFRKQNNHLKNKS